MHGDINALVPRNVVSSKEYFVARQRYKGNPFLNPHGNTQQFYIVLYYMAFGPYGGRERSVQGAGGETRGEETAG